MSAKINIITIIIIVIIIVIIISNSGCGKPETVDVKWNSSTLLPGKVGCEFQEFGI